MINLRKNSYIFPRAGFELVTYSYIFQVSNVNTRCYWFILSKILFLIFICNIYSPVRVVFRQGSRVLLPTAARVYSVAVTRI